MFLSNTHRLRGSVHLFTVPVICVMAATLLVFGCRCALGCEPFAEIRETKPEKILQPGIHLIDGRHLEATIFKISPYEIVYQDAGHEWDFASTDFVAMVLFAATPESAFAKRDKTQSGVFLRNGQFVAGEPLELTKGKLTVKPPKGDPRAFTVKTEIRAVIFGKAE